MPWPSIALLMASVEWSRTCIPCSNTEYKYWSMGTFSTVWLAGHHALPAGHHDSFDVCLSSSTFEVGSSLDEMREQRALGRCPSRLATFAVDCQPLNLSGQDLRASGLANPAVQPTYASDSHRFPLLMCYSKGSRNFVSVRGSEAI